MCTETFKNSEHVKTCQENIEDLDMCTDTFENRKLVKTCQDNITESRSTKSSDSSPVVIDGCGSSRHSEGVNVETILESDNSNESSTHINGSGTISSPLKSSSSFSSSESSSHHLFKVDTIIFTKSGASIDSIGPAPKGEQSGLSSESSANSEVDNSTPGPPSTSQVYDGILGLGMSPTSSPPVQVMNRSTEYDPNRIPDSVFATSNCNTPMEWSLASNESLFSIPLENVSFSRNQMIVEMRKSEELNKSHELNKVSPLSPVTLAHTDNSRKSDEIEDLQTTETVDKVSERDTEIQKDVKNSYLAICCSSSCCSSSFCNVKNSYLAKCCSSSCCSSSFWSSSCCSSSCCSSSCCNSSFWSSSCCSSSCCSSSFCSSTCCNSSCVSCHSHGSGHAFALLINKGAGQCCYCSWPNCYCEQLSCQCFNCCWAFFYCCGGYKKGNDHASPILTGEDRKSSVKADVQRQISEKERPELNSSSGADRKSSLKADVQQQISEKEGPELNSSSTANDSPDLNSRSTIKSHWRHYLSWPWFTCGNCCLCHCI